MEYFIKPLERIGCDVHSTLIIDVSEKNFYYNKESGLVLPWKGQRKDTKLIDLLDLLRPILVNEVVV